MLRHRSPLIGNSGHPQRNTQSTSSLMLICINCDDGRFLMRTTVTIDDELYQRALDVADPGMGKGDLFCEAMKVFVRVQAGKRLAALGGKAHRMKNIPRRRPAEVLPR